MIRSLLRSLPVVALATMLAAVPAAATGNQNADEHRADNSQQQRADDHDAQRDDGETAHPSGKSRDEEPGGSGTQGKSPSDPDGDTNGGEDKPGGEGGYDDDKDGNNGCGNDDDFEDDNNGNCGGPDQQADDRDLDETSNTPDQDRDETSESRASRSKAAKPEARSDRSWQQTRSEHERTRTVTSLGRHCEGHDSNTRWQGPTGSHAIGGVTIAWNGEQLTITNPGDTQVTVTWCAKGGNGFAGDTTNTGINTDTLAAGATLTRTFARTIGYVVLYDTDTDVAAGDEQTTTIDNLNGETATTPGNTTGGDGAPADDSAVLSGELAAAPDTHDDTTVAAAGIRSGSDVTTAAGIDDDTEAAAAAADGGEIAGSDLLALTGGSIAFLAILALLTLGGGSLLVRRNEQH